MTRILPLVLTTLLLAVPAYAETLDGERIIVIDPGTGRLIDPYRRTLGALITPAGDVAAIMLREGLVLPWHTGKAAKRQRLITWCGPEAR